MYLYLGQNTVVPKSSVVAVFDMDNTTQSKQTMEFLRRAQREGRLVSVTDDLPKAFAVCEENGTTTVYLCQLSTATLLRRSETALTLEDPGEPGGETQG